MTGRITKEGNTLSGTIEGGKRAAATNKAKFGADFYRTIGAQGGKKGRTGGFYGNPELARAAGAIGGSRSKPGTRKKTEEPVKKSRWSLSRIHMLSGR